MTKVDISRTDGDKTTRLSTLKCPEMSRFVALFSFPRLSRCHTGRFYGALTFPRLEAIPATVLDCRW